MMPTRVALRPQGLRLDWENASTDLPAGLLRRRCRCADCLSGRVDREAEGVLLVGAEPVGGYGLQLRFSDGHERGIYPWQFLYGLTGAEASGEVAGSGGALGR